MCGFHVHSRGLFVVDDVDSSSQTGGRSVWTNQNVAQNSLQLASVNTVGSPNLNIANLTGLQGNVNMQAVNRIHASGPVQVNSLQ